MDRVELETERVLAFWMGELDADGLCSQAFRKKWWGGGPQLDAEVQQEFGALFADLRAGIDPAWNASARTQLAAVIVLDQFSRNMFRGSGDMYAGDALACVLAKQVIDSGRVDALAPHEKMFIYMPLMHSEDLADQEQCVALFKQVCTSAAGGATRVVETMQQNLDYAIQHRDIVARFGRFPHRNALLGRDSTEEEVEFLKQPGSSF